VGDFVGVAECVGVGDFVGVGRFDGLAVGVGDLVAGVGEAEAGLGGGLLEPLLVGCGVGDFVDVAECVGVGRFDGLAVGVGDLVVGAGFGEVGLGCGLLECPALGFAEGELEGDVRGELLLLAGCGVADFVGVAGFADAGADECPGAGRGRLGCDGVGGGWLDRCDDLAIGVGDGDAAAGVTSATANVTAATPATSGTVRTVNLFPEGRAGLPARLRWRERLRLAMKHWSLPAVGDFR
jgi:hypothetical protein